MKTYNNLYNKLCSTEPSIDGDRQEVLIDIVKNEALCLALIEKQNKELNEKIKK